MPSRQQLAVRHEPENEFGNARADARSNLFVTAALYSATASAPVRIRNMSRRGAMVEGGILPGEGMDIKLCRGSLGVSGRVVWRDRNRAGLRFDCSIIVGDWLPRGNRPSPQQKIDEIVFQAKRGSRGPEDLAPANTKVASDAKVGATAQLAHFAESLEQIAEQLVADAGVAARFPAQLQVLDAIAQRVMGLALAMAPSPPGRD